MKTAAKIVNILLGVLLVLCLLLVSPLFIPYFLFKGYYSLKNAYLNYRISSAKKRAARTDPPLPKS